jgi:hypothetical protein
MAFVIALCLTLSLVGSATQTISQSQSAPAQSKAAEKPSDTATKPPPVPDATGKYQIGNGVTIPKLIGSAQPEATDKMRKKKLGFASCVVGMVVEIDGSVDAVHIVSSFPDTSDKKLRDAVLSWQAECVRAVKQYRFEPATYQGRQVAVDLKTEITFQGF